MLKKNTVYLGNTMTERPFIVGLHNCRTEVTGSIYSIKYQREYALSNLKWNNHELDRCHVEIQWTSPQKM